ncbi:MAG: hypothetical protein JNL19_08740 [Burkholderiales bacterium]|nr:hypothetical protein [Burkholderiales bacterium]
MKQPLARASAAYSSLVVLFVATALGGCVDEARVRELTAKIERDQAAEFFARRASQARELNLPKACCDDVTTVRPHGRADAERPFVVSPGVWPSTQALEFAGFRSYYALVAFEPLTHDRGHLKVSTQVSARRYVDSATGRMGGEIFVPVVAFLDAKRELIEVSPVQVPKPETPNEATLRFRAPRDAAFAAIFTNAEALAIKDMTVLIPAATTAIPIGSTMIAVRTPAQLISLLPGRVGTLSISLE